MTCEGCSGAVNRVLGRLKGKKELEEKKRNVLNLSLDDAFNNNWQNYHTISEVTKVDIDMEGQRVFIESTLSSEELLATLKKTGRECSYVGVKQ